MFCVGTQVSQRSINQITGYCRIHTVSKLPNISLQLNCSIQCEVLLLLSYSGWDIFISILLYSILRYRINYSPDITQCLIELLLYICRGILQIWFFIVGIHHYSSVCMLSTWLFYFLWSSKVICNQQRSMLKSFVNIAKVIS